jgi:Tfp pilus assembly protein FimT
MAAERRVRWFESSGRVAVARCRAMTLLEIVLTLSLLVILAAMTWPALGRPMARQRLRGSADQVRTEWVRARVEAMSSNRTYVFRYTPDGDTYTIQAYASEDEAACDVPVEGSDTESPPDASSRQRRLADKVRFVVGEAQSGASTGTMAIGDAPSSAEAGQPIFFYSDGTCSDAQLQLINEYGNTITLSLRGLTGVVTVSESVATEAVGP